MARDRLDELQMRATKLEKEKKNKASTGVENGSTSSDTIELFERTEVVRQSIENIEQNVEEIKGNLVKLEDIRFNQSDVRDRLESLFQQNTSLSRQVTQKLKAIQSCLKKNDDSAQGRIQTIQYNTLRTRFQKAFSSNTSQLENYQKIEKDKLRAHLRAKGQNQISDDELTALIDGKQLQVFTENIITETAEARRMLADIEERHDLLLKIEHMLTEVRELFLHLAVLVDQQGEMVDRVEYQAAIAKDHVGKGKKELRSADEKKRKFLKKKIYCGVIIMVVVVIIILVFVFAK